MFFLQALLIQAIKYDNTFITTNNDCPSNNVRLTASLFLVSSSLRRAPHHHRNEGPVNERCREENPPQATTVKKGNKGDDTTGDVKWNVNILDYEPTQKETPTIWLTYASSSFVSEVSESHHIVAPTIATHSNCDPIGSRTSPVRDQRGTTQ